MSFLAWLGIGFVLGAAVLGAVLWRIAPRLMLSERRSPLGLDETVSRIEEAAKAAGWNVQSVLPLEESVKKQGGPEVRPVRLVNLCKGEYSGKILAEDGARLVSVMMPCTISVYQKSDGTVWMGSMNPGLLGRMFGGVVSEVMAGPVAREQARFLASVE